MAALVWPATALAAHTADVSGLADGGRACSECHLADIVAEHTKATSDAAGCNTCHSPRTGNLYQLLAGNWSHTCDEPLCHSATGWAQPVHENHCLACHDVSQADFATSKVSFTAGAPVDRDTACKACHAPGLVGTHPYHQIGSNCGSACHPGWGTSFGMATPAYSDPVSGASFARADSKDTTPALLHTIHADVRWPAGVDTPQSACASCHAAAACDACHTGALPASHAEHSSSDQTANPAWVGPVAYGVVGGDQSQHSSFTDTVQCASVGCHDSARSAAGSAHGIEDYNHAPGANLEEPGAANSAIATIGPWRYRASTRYSGGRMSYSNFAGASLTATFTGERVELVSDRDPYRGTAWVWVDETFYGTIDTYAPTSQYQAVVFGADVPSGEHTIAVYPTGTKNTSSRGAYVVIDGFRVYSDLPTTAVPTCISCHADRLVTH